MQPQVYPWKITIDPPQCPPGEDVHVTIELNQTTTTALILQLATDPVGVFVNMPQAVTVPPGASQYSLTLTVAQGQAGAVLFTASSRWGEAAGAFCIPGVTACLKLAA